MAFRPQMMTQVVNAADPEQHGFELRRTIYVNFSFPTKPLLKKPDFVEGRHFLHAVPRGGRGSRGRVDLGKPGVSWNRCPCVDGGTTGAF